MNTHDTINDRAARELLAYVALERIPGECIAAAMRTLPPPTLTSEPASVDTVAPHGVGPVRLFFAVHRPPTQLRRRGVSPFWICTGASRLAEI